MSRKLSLNEIRKGAEHSMSTWHEDGEFASRAEAKKLQEQMILSGNTDPDSIEEFNRYASQSWDYLLLDD